MSYLAFLQWIISLAASAPAIFAALQVIAEQVAAIAAALGQPQQLVTGDDAESSADTLAAENEVLALVTPTDPGSLAVRDGSKLRNLFAVLGPMLPTLIALFGKK
jgi:hypothetical protein